MSDGYGLLAQSTIIPKKSVQIKIKDNSGSIVMQTAINKQKQKIKFAKFNKSIHKNKQIKRNKGIDQRNKKDQEIGQKNKFIQKNYYKCLQKKAQSYDYFNRNKINGDKLLVDFQAKQQQLSKSQRQQFEKQRQLLYNGEIKNIQSQQKALHQTIQTQKLNTTQLRERLAWQKQMYIEMKGDYFQINKPKVFQSFDKIMSKQQKQAFSKVINEQELQKNKVYQIKKRKQIMDIERMKKLKKFNIIAEVKETDQDQKNISKN